MPNITRRFAFECFGQNCNASQCDTPGIVFVSEELDATPVGQIIAAKFVCNRGHAGNYQAPVSNEYDFEIWSQDLEGKLPPGIGNRATAFFTKTEQGFNFSHFDIDDDINDGAGPKAHPGTDGSGQAYDDPIASGSKARRTDTGKRPRGGDSIADIRSRLDDIYSKMAGMNADDSIADIHTRLDEIYADMISRMDALQVGQKNISVLTKRTDTIVDACNTTIIELHKEVEQIKKKLDGMNSAPTQDVLRDILARMQGIEARLTATPAAAPNATPAAAPVETEDDVELSRDMLIAEVTEGEKIATRRIAMIEDFGIKNTNPVEFGVAVAVANTSDSELLNMYMRNNGSTAASGSTSAPARVSRSRAKRTAAAYKKTFDRLNNACV